MSEKKRRRKEVLNEVGSENKRLRWVLPGRAAIEFEFVQVDYVVGPGQSRGWSRLARCAGRRGTYNIHDFFIISTRKGLFMKLKTGHIVSVTFNTKRWQ